MNAFCFGKPPLSRQDTAQKNQIQRLPHGGLAVPPLRRAQFAKFTEVSSSRTVQRELVTRACREIRKPPERGVSCTELMEVYQSIYQPIQCLEVSSIVRENLKRQLTHSSRLIARHLVEASAKTT